MPRWFNTAGPCNPKKHYTLPPTARLPDMERLISRESYFVIHAPRQTGKTTAMLALAKDLTASGKYTAVVVSAEVGAPFKEDHERAELNILSAWQRAAQSRLPENLQPPDLSQVKSGTRLAGALALWARTASRPLVIFIDEIDALQDEILLSVLRQLRDGFPSRPQNFPASLALIGLRDVRDYKIASGGSNRLNTSSPFNIKVESLTLRNFSQSEIAILYQQHTDETGQVFTAEAIAQSYKTTYGQPWLVNALARQIVEELVPNPAIPITAEHVIQATNRLIQRQDTHLDSLASKLIEPRVQSVMEPLIAGQLLDCVQADDIQYVLDLGLCRRTEQGEIVVANPVYKEIIARDLASVSIASLPPTDFSWLASNGELDITRLLDSFLDFWRQHGQPMFATAPYHEIAPHIVLMAFLHRVANGGGQLTREYAIGSDRLDICLRYKQTTLAMELKVWRDGRPDPLTSGLQQLDKYLLGLGLTSGWLVIFDQRAGQPPIAERTTTKQTKSSKGNEITVIRA